MIRKALIGAVLATGLAASPVSAGPWEDTLAAARGTTVYWNAWGGDERNNAFIAWAGEQVSERYGVTLNHVKLADTAEAVTRVLAEKTAGRTEGGSVDLIWINGANFLSMKEQGLLHGPFADMLPNYRYVDTDNKPSNVVDFTVPVDGMESPWRMAQVVFAHDTARVDGVPRTIRAFVDWAAQHPGRFAHPAVRDFLGATFLKQALYELAPDPAVLQRPADEADFAAVTAPLWSWYDQLRPNLWRSGRQFPDSGPGARQLLDDAEIDLTISFDPAEPAGWIEAGLAPPTVRAYTLDGGTIGNTSFVAIPFNAANKAGAEVVANFLLDPGTQAHAQDIRFLGSFTVLDLDRLEPDQRQLFADLPTSPALPTNAELGRVLLEPHPSWTTRIVDEWTKRYGQ